MGLFGGGKSAVAGVALPDFYTDEYFTKTQKDLYGYGTDIMGGKLPDFYSSLGQTGSKQFKDMLDLVNRDTAMAVQENLVRRNISRSGAGLSAIAKATADATTKLSWQDFLKASGEKQNLLNLGLSTVGSVGEKALSFGGQKNQFNLSKTQLELSQAQAKDQAKAAKDAMWGKIISSGIGAAAILATGGAAAPLVAGGMMAGGVGGTNTGMQTASGINNGNPFPTWSPYKRGE
jgi:hypothetical protein